ncbi:isoprenyl transferase [Ligilactobacillus apodemi]|uniref:Isoprenyl transferase n=1 Tax=Ligilactobacillus apodemi DSM 16634 = JCM 16172 TaxID=1423724 RepID=A0A0R1TS75_9LACO|nr:isoprenyl transferase [Ligilactobacillus apodemi]KRL84057.1 di-trans-poly-cis-decaprenylcistransferase [Ligilactobacillus apodemi DSM 16634 = JCM 16172]
MFANLFNKDNKSTKEDLTLDPNRIPTHIAIIMDGNGRWAKKRGLPRVAGHKQGMETVKTITKVASDLGVKVLTLYAFSTENWKRPNDEVGFLMDLPVKFFNTFVPELIENNVRVNVMGYAERLPEKTKKAVDDAIEQTKNNTGMILNFALNYGSRAELTTAVQAIASEIEAGNLTSNEITEDTISQALMTNSVKPYNDPELLIRTSGEERISNFLLWQIAYSELVFTDVLWPDFSAADLKENISIFQQRDRRFGGLNKKDLSE